MRKSPYVGKKAREWAKHLKPTGKRLANKSERKTLKSLTKKEKENG